MTSHRSISLFDLLKPDFQHAQKIGWEDAEQEEEMLQVKEALKSEISGLEWDQVKEEIYRQLNKLLDVPLASVLSKAWSGSGQIKQTIEKQLQTKSDDVAVIPLRSHKIQSQHTPKLKVVLNDSQIGQFPLTAKFAFRFNNVLLKIQHGKIQAILAGKCHGVASLTYQDVILEEKQISEFELSEYVLMQEKASSPSQVMNEDDIMTEQRIPSKTHHVAITSQEETAAIVPVSRTKKFALFSIGILISLIIIAAISLFI